MFLGFATSAFFPAFLTRGLPHHIHLKRPEDHQPHSLLWSRATPPHMPALPTLPHTSELELFFSCSLTSPNHRRSSLSPLKRQSLPERSLFFSGGPEHRLPACRTSKKAAFWAAFPPGRSSFQASSQHHTDPLLDRPAEGSAPRAELSAGRRAGPRSRGERAPNAALAPGLPRISTAAMAAPRTSGTGRRAGSGPAAGRRSGAGAQCRRAPLGPARSRWPGKHLPEGKGCAAPASRHKSKGPPLFLGGA